MIRQSRLRYAVFLLILGTTLPAGAMAQTQRAQALAPLDYPTKSIRVIVPTAPSGGTDLIARLLAQKVGTAWGQPLVVDNRGGGGGTLGTNTVAKAAPDGYTLLLTSMSVTYAPALYRDLPYDLDRELTAVTLIASQPSLLVVNASLSVNSLQDFIALAKSKPGELRFCSGGSGSAPHLATELLQQAAGIKLLHIPYKGGAPALTALMAGEAQLLIAAISTLLPHVRAGKLRALAVTGEQRAKAAAELPTLAEAGVRGAEFDGWYGLLTTAGTPAVVIAKINGEFKRALGAADVREKLIATGLEPLGGTQERFATYLKTESKKWTAIARAAGIRAE